MDTAIVIGGGQCGLGTAFTLRNHGFRPVVLEAGAETVGSWPRYYDSLVLFTPARLSALPGMPFPGEPSRLPTRDEVVAYLRDYASRLDCEIRTGTRVTSVVADREGYVVTTGSGERLHAPVVVAATGNFDNPHRPEIPGLAGYSGRVVHSAEYRSPEPFAGRRVVVVGAASSAVQIAHELSGHADVTLASRKPIKFSRTPFKGGEPYLKLVEAAFRLPVGELLLPDSAYTAVIDEDGAYRAAFDGGKPDRREMFTAADGTELRWPDGRREHVDAVLLATGYRPALDYLRPLGALDRRGVPRQRRGLSTVHPGLAFMGLRGLRTPLSAGLHGVGPDATHIARRLRRWIATTEPAWRRRPAA
ncbi:flavin-containing monooxygenase [Streptomyces sp. NPDC017979]|uniref:flavin-containing monooxygenase n=1 Tax=Streptomyces sp. NPDC017979 TaxID=3365024 RepID=UPI00378BF8C9